VTGRQLRGKQLAVKTIGLELKNKHKKDMKMDNPNKVIIPRHPVAHNFHAKYK
jgi:hypothetical protein